jgi:hypothetical protein
MVLSVATGAKHPIDRKTHWNFGDPHGHPVSLDEFLAQKEAAASNSSLEKSRGWWVSANSAGKPSSGSALKRWTISVKKAIKLVIEYCLEVLEEVKETIRGKASLARLEATLKVQ